MKKIKYILIILILLISILIFINIKENKSYYKIISYSNSKQEGYGICYKIVNNTSYIITNYHVIENSYKILVDKYEANLVGFDKYRDIALLKIDNVKLNTIKLSNRNLTLKDEIKIYDVNNNKYIKGTINNLSKSIYVNNSYYDAIEINSKFSEGNSGSPVLDKYNNVLGIVSVMNDNKKIGYAIDIKFAIKIADKLRNNESTRIILGATFKNTLNGVEISNLKENYTLKKYNFENFDIIVSIDDTNINNTNELINKLYEYNIGDNVKIGYKRNNILYYQKIIF